MYIINIKHPGYIFESHISGLSVYYKIKEKGDIHLGMKSRYMYKMPSEDEAYVLKWTWINSFLLSNIYLSTSQKIYTWPVSFHFSMRMKKSVLQSLYLC